MPTGKTPTKYSVLLFFVLWAAPALYGPGAARVYAQQATISETRQTFRTYPYGDPSPVAVTGRIYPYFRFDGYSTQGQDRDWTIVTLENPYIRVLVAPEIGGKILGAFEKSTGQPFIYYNKVIKFRDIGMRGAWTSGGIELNFGSIGHAPSTASPVDYLLRTNDDGSVSCFVGTMDITSRTEWRMEIRLPADKAYFETNGLWYNPTVLHTSQYQWMNGAADARNDLRLYHPGQYYLGHDGDASPWPVDAAGRDLSLYRNNDFGPSKSYHVMGAYDEYFGGTYGDAHVGFGHWAPYEDKPGKKVWIWSLSRSGAIWENLLTDTDLGNTQYVEIQTGLLLNQAAGASSRTPFKHLFFDPLSDLRFREAWFPVKDIGGIVDANLTGSLNVRREAGGLSIGLCALQEIDDDLTVTAANGTVVTRRIRLHPMDVYQETIPFPDGAVAVTLGNGKLSWSNADKEARKLSRPVSANREFDWESAAGLCTAGAELAKQRDYDGALEQYLACLRKDPVYSPALTGMAELYYRRMEYDTALGYALKALANDTYDPGANFIYGAISFKLGKPYDAKDGYSFAAKSMTYRSAAQAQLAAIYLTEGDPARAGDCAQQALAYNRYNINALEILALACRKQGQRQAAEDALREILRIDPLNHFARFESWLLSGDVRQLDDFTQTIRPELPHEIYLELAVSYYNLRCFEEAAKVLAHAPVQPVVLLWQAFLVAKAGDRAHSAAKLRDALTASPYLVYPFREETAGVLQWAMEQGAHWKLRYYQALIYASRGRQADAARLFDACGNEPDFAPFYLTRAALTAGTNQKNVPVDYERALALDRNAWRTYHLLSDYYTDQGRYDHSLAYAQTGAQQCPGNYVLQFDLATARLHTNDYAGCLAILDTLVILPNEGARYGHDTYRSACILGALQQVRGAHIREAAALIDKARLWPETLGVGKPYDTDERIEDFAAALCCRKSGDAAGAERAFRNVIAAAESQGGRRNSGYYLYVLALREMGMREQAASAMADWTQRTPPSMPAQWAQLHFSGKKAEAEQVLSGYKTGKGGTPWDPAGGDADFKLVTEVVRAME